MRHLVLLSKLGATYVALQVITGVEVGILAAGLTIATGMPLPSALAATLPLGMPLLLGQGLIVLACVQTGPATQ